MNIYKDIIVCGKRFKLIYNEVLTDSDEVNKISFYLINKISKRDIKNLIKKLPNSNCLYIKSSNIDYYLNNGFIIIKYNKIIAVEARSKVTRSVSTISSELSIGGAKDAFVEVINTNLCLIKRRIKYGLITNSMEIGRISKSKCYILSIEGITNNRLVNNIIDRLKDIDIDGIMDSSYLKFAIESHSIFPTIMMSERPDKCSMALLEGKVVVLIDGSCYGLILPSFFLDFFHTTDDYFQKSFNTTFIRIIRVIAFLVAIFLPAIYISVTTRNYNLVPYSLLLMLKAGRSFVPFPAYIEAICMILAFEILKESDLRMSNTSGSAVSILGGLILGDAAVEAGIVSPIMIIIVALSSISGLIFTSIELVNAIRFYKILLLLLSTLFGIYGVILGFIIMIYNLYNTEIFGYNYLLLDKGDSIIKSNPKIKLRRSFLTHNIVRGRIK